MTHFGRHGRIQMMLDASGGILSHCIRRVVAEMARRARPYIEPTLRSIRRREEKTLRYMARALGVAEKTLWRWEAGRTAPPADVLPRYAAELGCSIEQVVDLCTAALRSYEADHRPDPAPDQTKHDEVG